MISWLKGRISAENTSEEQLIQQIKKGETQEFGKIYTKYIDCMYRYIFFRVNCNKEDAEDLTEMVFYKAWQKIDKFQEEKGKFKTWLYTIAHNIIIDHYRNIQPMNTIQEDHIQTENTVEDLIIKDEKKELLLQAINKLTDEQKTVITLRFIEDFKLSEIAEILDKNEEAIRAVQYRGLKTLRRTLLNNSSI